MIDSVGDFIFVLIVEFIFIIIAIWYAIHIHKQGVGR